VDHGTGSRSQILIDATSTLPWYMNSRLSYRVATARPGYAGNPFRPH